MAMQRPIDAQRALRWMSDNADRLHELIAAQGERGNPIDHPADDGTIRANLQYLAEALHATAAPELTERMERYRYELQDWLDDQEGELDAHMRRAEGAIALQEHLQFGTMPGQDPSLDESARRRHRILAWLRLAAIALESALGPEFDGLADRTLSWMGERQRDFSRHVLTLIAHARNAYTQRTGRPALDAAATDEVGQTAVVRGGIRHFVNALQETTALV